MHDYTMTAGCTIVPPFDSSFCFPFSFSQGRSRFLHRWRKNILLNMRAIRDKHLVERSKLILAQKHRKAYWRMLRMERNFTLNFPAAQLPYLFSFFLSRSLSFFLFFSLSWSQLQRACDGRREITFRDSPLLSLQFSKLKTIFKLLKKPI